MVFAAYGIFRLVKIKMRSALLHLTKYSSSLFMRRLQSTPATLSAAASGVPLSRSLKSLTGHLTETDGRNGVIMTATLFEKSSGKKMSYSEYLNNIEVFKQLGQITGKIHKAFKTYTSPNMAN